MSVGKSVRLFLADGTPGGLLTAEIMNWTGHIMSVNRSSLGELLRRGEAKRTGIYILLGDDPDAINGRKAYVGEGDDVGKRLYAHQRSVVQGGKDFWTQAVVLTSKDDNLTKAHVRYLESRFVALGHQAKRATIDNGTNPLAPTLPESDVSDMEYFIEQAKIILPLLGVNIFQQTTKTSPQAQGEHSETAVESPVFEMRVLKEGVVATAQEIDGEFVVFAGSLARREWVGGESQHYRTLRLQLEDDGTLTPMDGGESFQFTRDYVFRSPSAAAAMVAGRNANGRMEWQDRQTGRTYGDWQDVEIDETAGIKPGLHEPSGDPP